MSEEEGSGSEGRDTYSDPGSLHSSRSSHSSDAGSYTSDDSSFPNREVICNSEEHTNLQEDTAASSLLPHHNATPREVMQHAIPDSSVAGDQGTTQHRDN